MKYRKAIHLLLSLASATPLALPAFTHAATPDEEKLVQPDPAQKSALADLESAQEELVPLLERGKVFGDDAKRKDAAPKVLPLLHRIASAFDTLKLHQMRTNRGGEFKFQSLAMLAYFGDDKTAAQLKVDAASKDDEVAAEAGVALALNDWWQAAHDEAAQKKIVATVDDLAKKHPKDDQITISLMMMGGTTPASPAMRESR